MDQSLILKWWFTDKWYSAHDIDAEIHRVSILDRNVLLADNVCQKDDQKFKRSFFTAFSVQHRQIKDIIKHWKVLKNDRYLGPVLLDCAAVIYRGATSMQGSVAPNVVDPPKWTSFFHQMKGFYPCCRCNVCHHYICGEGNPRFSCPPRLANLIQWNILPPVLHIISFIC